MIRKIDRRQVLASTSAFGLFAAAGARAQAPTPPAPSAPAIPDTNWLAYGNDLAATRYVAADQINASNFNSLEVAWRFRTDNFGPRPDGNFTCTPVVVKGRLYATVGVERYLVCLDAGTGQLLWMYRHDEKGRLGARAGASWGVSYWTDGTAERIFYVTRSYQLISIDIATGRPDPAFGTGTEVDLRLDWDHDVDPVRPIVGLHAAPTIVRNTVVVGAASASTGPGHLRGFDARTGKRKWIFHTVPQKGEFGYDTWLTPGQAESATNTGVWAPMSADEELGLVYAGVELPQADTVGVTRHGNALFSECLVALDCETGERRWHYQLEHHGLWDRDMCCAAVLFDLQQNGKVIKALAQPSKQAFLFVLDRTTGKPVWAIPEKPVPKGDVPGEWYSPTQPFPSKPPPFDRQGFTTDDVIDWTPEIKARALAIVAKYRIGPMYTPPSMVTDTNWGTLQFPESQGGANWPGGSYDPETGIFYLYSKTTPHLYGQMVGANGRIVTAQGTGRGANDGGHGGQGGPPIGEVKDGLNDPIERGVLTIGGMSIGKPPWGRITAIDMKNGTQLWQVVHGETPDFVTNNPLLKGIKVPRTGQSGILGTLSTKSLLICGDSGFFTDEQGRKGARLRAYDKLTGKEVGAVFTPSPQTGAAMTYMLGGRQHLVTSNASTALGAELICFRLPAAPAAGAARPAAQPVD
jgi:quinoprotein glucose dehydrogenase